MLGRQDGSVVGLAEGEYDGHLVGTVVADPDGEQLGHCDVGNLLGAFVGSIEGKPANSSMFSTVGADEGLPVVVPNTGFCERITG